eukprot:TRINITY_DN23663_c0_g1_i1.p1 TRINITY_DN23663_c0_g1~~TRINITY_DN23663_c0_g1_i1.p1  ORF type:complete len:118 (+),score=10.55 TRINITY_DN23663_c0_g1_i1:223-576(+)
MQRRFHASRSSKSGRRELFEQGQLSCTAVVRRWGQAASNIRRLHAPHLLSLVKAWAGSASQLHPLSPRLDTTASSTSSGVRPILRGMLMSVKLSAASRSCLIPKRLRELIDIAESVS